MDHDESVRERDWIFNTYIVINLHCFWRINGSAEFTDDVRQRTRVTEL